VRRNLLRITNESYHRSGQLTARLVDQWSTLPGCVWAKWLWVSIIHEHCGFRGFSSPQWFRGSGLSSSNCFVMMAKHMGSLVDPSGPKAHLRRQQKAHPAKGRKTPWAYFPRVAPTHAAHEAHALAPHGPSTLSNAGFTCKNRPRPIAS
jgi:hypothetical protein